MSLNFHVEQLHPTAARLLFSPEYSYRQVSMIASLCRECLPWLVEAVPAYRQLLIEWQAPHTFDSTQKAVEQVIGRLVSTHSPDCYKAESNRNIRREPINLPVCYHPSLAPDLNAVADQLKLTPEQVINVHVNAQYHIDAIGFMPGFAYLGGLPSSLHTPRRHSPRTQVPAGSVAIAEDKTAVYPLAAPGGWNLIGRSPSPLGSASSLVSAYNQPNESLLSVGQQVSFYSISLEEYHRLQGLTN